MKYLISTISDLATEEYAGDVRVIYSERTLPLAVKNGLGLELAEFCLPDNLDVKFESVRADIEHKASSVELKTLHAPFNELYPMAIDPKIVEVAYERYDQAWKYALRFGASKMIVHANYNDDLYFPGWFIDRHTRFWKRFLSEHEGDIVICVENVAERDPKLITGIIKGVDDPRLRMCLDVGHANLSGIEPIEWVRACAPYVSHYHIHNNFGAPKEGKRSWGDRHLGLGNGIIDMKALLSLAEELTPDATAAIESYEPEASVQWLRDNGFL